MAEEKPSPVTYHEYDIPSLNSVFAWSAALLFVVSAWMIWADYEREWKGYQRRFRDVEVVRTKKQITAADAAVDKKALAEVQGRLTAGEQALKSHAADRDKLRQEKDALTGKWYAADQLFKFRKAELDVARYEVDEARLHKHDVPGAEKKFKTIKDETEKRRVEFEDVDRKMADVDARIAALEKQEKDAAKDQDKLLAEKSRLQKKLDSLGNDATMRAVNFVRNAPLLDFFAPTLKVKQVILPDLHADVNFLTVPRVDRCHTCHLAIDKPGYTEKELAPEFRTHSRLPELIAKHPVERFGCTGCHSGSGLAITFSDAAHVPRDEKQMKEWEEKKHWHELHHWDFPQLPLQLTEAHCANCHAQQTRIPGADTYNAGRDLVESLGCFGCHKIDKPGYEELRKVGPELGHIRGKVTREWMTKWVKDPKSFRPSTKMPRIWGNSNTAQAYAGPGQNYPVRDDVEVESVVRYLLAKSKDYAALPPLPRGLTGDPKKGEWVVTNRGCKACHVVGAKDTGEGRFGAHFGPELSQVGSKLTPEWTYAWIKDPKAMWPETKMPNLRLDDQEALDAAAYLLTLRNEPFETAKVPDVATAEAKKTLEEVTYEYLRKETTTADAQARLAKMDEEARYQYLGAKLIGRYGCFGCHMEIPGFENAQRIGTELTTWSSKLLTQLDFGLVHLPHTKHDWLRAKLTDPRTFDQGKVESKDPQDLLKMPNFRLSPKEVDLVMTVVLGLERDYVQPSAHRVLKAEEQAVERGRRVIRNNNCQGCHTIDNVGGGMEKVVEGGRPFSPPVLGADYTTLDGRTGKTRQGAKVQPDWFFGFLKAPTPIRPWLNLRMPTFGLSDADATSTVEAMARKAEVPYPYASFDRDALDPQLVAEGQKLFATYQCISCHLPLEEAKKLGRSAEDLAPNLELAKHRLRYDWLAKWLKDPDAIQKNTKMPSFFYRWDSDAKSYTPAVENPDHQIDALRAYLEFHGEGKPEAKVAETRTAHPGR